MDRLADKETTARCFKASDVYSYESKLMLLMHRRVYEYVMLILYQQNVLWYTWYLVSGIYE